MKISKRKNNLSYESKVVVELIKLLEENPNKDNSTIPDLALYIAKNCRIVVV